jgi:Tol biopolymer transport system component
MKARALLALAGALVSLTALTAPREAGAFYANAADAVEGAQLVSADYARLEQGDDTTRFAAVSGNGRYVAMQTRARNFFADSDPDPAGQYRAGGIFRFDLQTRALVKVADGDLFDEAGSAFLRRGAANPSISADGRYVAFTTAQQLNAADLNSNMDVYVRDMDEATGAAGAYTLVSARNGSAVPATFAPPATPFPGGNPGADVSPGVAISADGSRVAFRTEAESDLPAQAGTSTPGGQIFVRDIPAQTTTLVTATRESATGAMTATGAGGALGAALSADGSTVAWTGRNAGPQTRFLGGENPDPSFNYYLWRRAPFGASDPTRRITGVADPDDAFCRQAEEANPGMSTSFDPEGSGPCFGPLIDQEATRSDIGSQLPALSGDGYTVAYLTGSGPRPLVQSGPGLDLYVTDMHPGLTRKSANVELTRDGSSSETATSSPLTSVAMAADGRHLAITTSRTQFTLPALSLVGNARAVAGPRELYVVDLATRTIERATRSIGGGDIDAGVQDGVTLSADGSRVAFSSFAGNLFRGDANQRADAFVASFVASPGEGQAPPPPEGGASSVTVERAGPRVTVRAKAKAGGVVVLTISVPAAGAIEASASARAGRPPKRQQIASRSTRARGKGSFNVVMRPEPRFRPTLDSRKPVRARIKVGFKPAGGGRKLHASTSIVLKGA